MRTTRRAAVLLGFIVLATCTHRSGPVTSAQPSPAGHWVGVAQVPGAGTFRLLITLDSSSGGWGGGIDIPSLSQKHPLRSVSRAGDSLLIVLDDQQSAELHLRYSSDGRRLEGRIRVGAGGTVLAGREGSPEVGGIIAPVMRREQSQIAASKLAQTAPAPPFTGDPDSAKLVTTDIGHFWLALDRAPADSLAEYLQRDYLDVGSFGVREFIPGRISSAVDLADYVADHRAVYDSVRAANLDLSKAEPAIRAAFRRLKQLYPAAVFPDVYFVIGRFNSGGTSTSHGLLIGAEMYRDPAGLPGIVSHELIHFQQHYSSPALLERAFAEGSADFIGAMISGADINNTAYRYGIAHEHELWQEFRKAFDSHETYPWMYGRPPDGKPNDLGYFIGHRIAQAYFNAKADKPAAIHDIILADGLGKGTIRRMLAESGYDP